MPELPEVETIVRGLAKRVIGDRIESVWTSDKPQSFKSPPAALAATLGGASIAAVRRMGKHIIFDLSKGLGAPSFAERSGAKGGKKGPARVASQWIVHLGMTGSLLLVRPDTELPKHTHLILRLASERELRFVDPRRFGRTWIVREAFATPGTEPLDIGLEMFTNLFRSRKTPIKSALLNQKLLRGVGNIYADESLFRAGIRPRRRAGSLTRDELKRLYKSVQKVLTEAIAAGGTSISDYVDSDGETGLFQVKLRVYGREGEPCVRCGTLIKRIVVAGRGTHYCPKCQR
jgi:formamidopyrimidine-DNA glycosylase